MPLAYTKTFALIASVIIALAVIPPLAHLLFRGRRQWKRSLQLLPAGLVLAGLALMIASFYWSGGALIILAGVLFSLWQARPFLRPDGATALALIMAICAGVGAYACLMRAMRTGDVSAVTPFRYTRLLFGIALGVLVFEEHLTWPMLVGSGLIVLSGLFILQRGKRAAAQ